MKDAQRLRVCHVVENLDFGAVENWLVRSYKFATEMHIDLDWTFYCILPETGRLDECVRSLGAEVIHSPCQISSTMQFMKAFRRHLIREEFDILHCHHDFLSALYLLSAVGLPIQRRLVHVHNTDESLPVSPWKQRLLLEPFRRICLTLADRIVGISNHTLDQFLKSRTRKASRDSVLYYGVDTQPMRNAVVSPVQFRSEIGLPPDAKVVLFIGRLAHLKNPVFVVDVLKELLELEPNAFAVFAGAGDLDKNVVSRAEELSISNRIRMLGWRDDAPYLMKNSDLFLFPRLESPVEGLGLVVVESQACGLPMLTTSGIGEDAVVEKELVTVVPLNAGAKTWAQQAAQLIKARTKQFDQAAGAIENSHFNLARSVTKLLSHYAGLQNGPKCQS